MRFFARFIVALLTKEARWGANGHSANEVQEYLEDRPTRSPHARLSGAGEVEQAVKAEILQFSALQGLDGRARCGARIPRTG